MNLLRAAASVVFLIFTVGVCTGNPTKAEATYGEAVETFILSSGYKGGASGVLLGNRLGFAEGFGHTLTGHNVHKETLFPASGISKIITAIAVLQLMEIGVIHPNDKVFGADGILSKYTPARKEVVDKRLFDITVDDLLHHAGGWDNEISQMADPIFNEFLVEGNQHITDIRKALNKTDELNVYEIIQFMATKPLDFEPGTQSAVSNLGYIILGRVIEEASQLPYDVVVKDGVLNPCGMWHTRLGPRLQEGQNVFKSRSPREIKAELREKHEVIGEYYAYVQTYLVDSCLGWFTNIYDTMRLSQCIDGSAGFSLLNDSTIDYMLSPPRKLKQETGETFFGVGFQVHRDGAVWVGDETHAPDVVYLHRDLKKYRSKEITPLYINRQETIDTKIKSDILEPMGNLKERDSMIDNIRREKREVTFDGDENIPISWVFLFEGKPDIDAPLKQLTRAMVEAETKWPQEDAFGEDIADGLVKLGTTTKLVKLKIEEHHANAYLIATKRAGYNVIWINAYTNEDHTYITVIAEKDKKASRECVAVAGLERDKLVQTKLKLQKEGYNMTFFQNYKSFSHPDKYIFLAVFHKGAFRNDSHTLYGIQHFDRPYKTLLELYEEKGYRPLVQSIEFKRDDALLSFILEADTSKEKDQKPIYASEENLSESKLEKYVRKYAREERRLIYLDASNHRGKPKFSALFKKTKMTKWLFSQGLSHDDMLTMVNEKQKEGYLPSIIVGYSTHKDVLQFATYMEKP